MSNNRFKTLTKLNIDYYEENTPVEIDKGVILLDTVSNQVLLQLKFRNISQYNINFIEIEVECFDSTGDKVSEDNVVTHAYQDFLATPHGLFGDRQAIKLPSLNSRKVNINLKRVMFDNGEVVTFNQIEKIPNPSLTRVETLPADLRDVVDRTIEYLPQDLGDNKWTCCCGRVNTNKTSCVRCGRDKEKQFKECDITHLEQLVIKRKEKEIKLQQEREERLKERHKMIRKLIPIGGCVVAVAIGIGIVANIRQETPKNSSSSDNPSTDSSLPKEYQAVQFRVTQNEEMLREAYGDMDFVGSSRLAVYIDSIIECEGKCESQYLNYDEAIELSTRYEQQHKEAIGWLDEDVYDVWWKENSSRFRN